MPISEAMEEARLRRSIRKPHIVPYHIIGDYNIFYVYWNGVKQTVHISPAIAAKWGSPMNALKHTVLDYSYMWNLSDIRRR